MREAEWVRGPLGYDQNTLNEILRGGGAIEGILMSAFDFYMCPHGQHAYAHTYTHSAVYFILVNKETGR